MSTAVGCALLIAPTRQRRWTRSSDTCLTLRGVINQADTGGNNAPAFRQPNPGLHLPTHLPRRAVAIK